jgi:hypothetical protein
MPAAAVLGDGDFPAAWIDSVPHQAFLERRDVQRVVVPDRFTTSGGSAFYGCSSLEMITLPDTLTKIGFQAFYCCRRVMAVSWPSALSTIGNLAFTLCTGLTEITLQQLATTASTGARGWRRSLCRIL